MNIKEESPFGERLKFLMNKNGLNSISMGKLAGKTSGNIRNWYRGVSFPRSDNLV